MHILKLTGSRSMPEDGLLMGNGDLSVSVYHDMDMVGFRFGKGDVWDRRIEYYRDLEEPVYIEELKRGIAVEKWKCGGYGGKVYAMGEQPKDMDRVHDVCQGCPRSYNNVPYPCPKPVGELQMFLPPDLPGLTVTPMLTVETGVTEIDVTSDCGVTIRVFARMHPTENVLRVSWKVEGLTEDSNFGAGHAIRFALYRWADPDPIEYAADYQRRYGVRAWNMGSSETVETEPVTPMAPPVVLNWRNHDYVVQRFQPEMTYPKGFECWMGAFGALRQEPVRSKTAATILLEPEDETEGELAVAVTTTERDGRMAHYLMSDLVKKLEHGLMETFDAEADADCGEFWSKSSLKTEDPEFETMWYDTVYAQKCIYKSGKMAPGLYLPSTMPDFCFWHGDYHSNYNIQQPFLGMPAENHIELMKPYFELVIDFWLPMGKMIAEKYYHCRGCFIQLSAYPMQVPDDILGYVPMGRMAYMTGYIMTLFQTYFRYTHDLEWLRDTAWPFMRECCLFYADFMEKGEDGLYHLFPSNQGEEGFNGESEPYRDRPQVMRHVEYALRMVLDAAGELGITDDLVEKWKDMLAHIAPPQGTEWDWGEGLLGLRRRMNPPDYGWTPALPYDAPFVLDENEPFEHKAGQYQNWYLGAEIIRSLMASARPSEFAEKDVRAELYREYKLQLGVWRRGSGMYKGMSVARYGRGGHYTEVLGLNFPLQEMLMQSWDDAIYLFPAWPVNKAASFENFLAEGGFEVSAACGEGKILSAAITAKFDGSCRVYLPRGMKITFNGAEVATRDDGYGRTEFDTEAGKTYELVEA